ncbi:MAG: hypothetical protein HDS65_07190 [Bacteroidales bacterium]|nr:hypothetical protein [Bacteroidales bacterium]
MNKRISLLASSIFLISSMMYGADADLSKIHSYAGKSKPVTGIVQQAIDYCSNTGGGTVTIPLGEYITGALVLKSGVELHLSAGCVLKGSTNHPDDYAAGRGVISAKGAHNCSVTGLGTIDGQGQHENFQRYGNNQGNRPHALFFEDCTDVTVKDVYIRNAAWWSFRLFRCDGVTIDNVKVYSHAIVNNDGIDIDARNVTVSNCRIDSDDDGICLKSDDPDFLPENIAITNCVIGSNCNPIKLGTSGYCGFRNISVSNCVIHRPAESNVWNWSKEYREVEPGELTGLAGIAVESVDGGNLENVQFSNITMTGVITPIFVCLNGRHGVGTLRNVTFENITAQTTGIIPTLISGVPGGIIDGITMRNIVVESKGRGTAQDASTNLPENLNGYPENRMYGHSNPAHGLYIRHAKNVSVDNFRINLKDEDARPAAVLVDVENADIEKLSTNGDKSIVKK